MYSTHAGGRDEEQFRGVVPETEKDVYFLQMC
jgi:hypothetical protein